MPPDSLTINEDAGTLYFKTLVTQSNATIAISVIGQVMGVSDYAVTSYTLLINVVERVFPEKEEFVFNFTLPEEIEEP